MTELQEAIENLDESRARLGFQLFQEMANQSEQERNVELGEFWRDVAALYSHQFDRVRREEPTVLTHDGEKLADSLPEVRWPSSVTACVEGSKILRAWQARDWNTARHNGAAAYGQIACQLDIRAARARRDGRELRRSLNGVRVHWLPSDPNPDPNPELVTIEFPIDTDGLPVF